MPGLFLPRRWTRQPQGPVEPADHWSVMSAFTPQLPWKKRQGGRIAGGADGMGFVLEPGPAIVSGTADVAGRSELSFLLYRYHAEDSTNCPLMAENYFNYWRFGLYEESGTVYFRTRNTTTGDTGGGQNLALRARTPHANEVRIGTYSVAKSRKAAFFNGKLDAETFSGVTAMTSVTSDHCGLGTSEAGYGCGEGSRIYLGVFAARAWSDAEAEALSENPWQIFKPRRLVLYSFPSGGAVHELAGDATAGASVAGDLTTGIQLDGDASAAATASGDLTTGIPLAGDATAAAQASGTLSTEIRLAAAALVSATATGSLSTAINLAGSAAFASLADGTLTTQIRLAGAAIAGAVADAGLSTQILLDADAQAGADASGELTTVPSGLAGDAVAGATASGALSVQIILAGDALASVLASGDLTTAGAGAELAADATVLAIASGGLTTAIQLTGAPVISVTASGELSIGLGMTAEALATVSAAAVLSTQIRMEGAAVASALAAGSLSVGTAEHGARRASWRGAARQGWTRPASVQRASRPRQYG